ncbi:MAG: hypothetical protein HW389_3759, partial [Bacteroidetes bacterium]|nr:hypothetical protein [Bacteroidota bacterium]
MGIEDQLTRLRLQVDRKLKT